MDKNRLLNLLNKYQDNSCTKEELQELEQWYHSLNTGNQSVSDTDTFANEMLMQFRQKLIVQKQTVPFYRKTFFRVAAAAVAILMLSIGSYFLFFNKPGTQKQLAGNQQTVKDLAAPNSAKAYITFSDGKIAYLDSLQNGTVTKEGSITVSKQGDQVIYTSNQQQAASSISYNTLTVPKGSKPFKLLLADGSTVWLDAATTITYPTTFVANERKVELNTGQAYFEVTHNASMPFKVKKGNAEVEVLGTHFNISAFDNEEMKVTLLQGSVKVSELTTQDSRLIKPGQQIVLTPDSRLKTNDSPDLDEVMAWKNGNFQFAGSDINTVMKQLARWYDVDVEIKGNIPAHFGGTISRDVNVSKVFEMLKLTGEVNYKIDGRKITVTP